MSRRRSLTLVFLLSMTAASCLSDGSYGDGAQVCDLLLQSELGTSISQTDGDRLPTLNGGSCVYISDDGPDRRVSLIVRRLDSAAEATEWMMNDAEGNGVTVDVSATSYHLDAASARSGVAVSGPIAVSLDDVGPLSDLTAEELEVLAADVARRADAAGFSMPVPQPT